MKKLFLVLSFLGVACTGSYEDKRSRSSHFKEGVFQNEASLPHWGILDVLKMRFASEPWASWPGSIPQKEGPPPKALLPKNKVRLTVIGHATVLIQIAGLNILADPIFSDRCSPVSFAGPKRVRKPAVPFEKIPKIDAVVISHDHYDHLDLPTLKKLMKRDSPKILVGLGVGAHLPKKAKVKELDWWESDTISSELKVTFVPTQHFSGRWLHDRMTTLWGAYVFEFGGTKVYFGGDSGYADHYKKTYEKFGAMNLSLIPIGAYRPRYFMKYAHLNPEEAVLAHKDLHSKKSVGIHYGTFQLTAEPEPEPEQELKKALLKHEVSLDDFITPAFGTPIQLTLWDDF